MQIDQALRALSQLKDAAPPTTSKRITEVMKAVSDLNAENTALSEQLAAHPIAHLVPQAFEILRPSMELVREQSAALRAGKLGRVTTEQADCLKLIYEHAASALTLVASLDEIGLMQQGVLAIQPTVFSGLDLLAEAWQMHVDAAELRDHQITVSADDPLPYVVGDYGYIVSILADMLENAVRYTPFGGVIRMTAESLGTHVLFSVADNGIGLNADDLLQVGQPFWRAMRQSLVRQHPGTGLRLCRAMRLLELHESELLFSGEPGMGSTFSFMLPVGQGMS